ncbi:MAG: S41 family peptidase [Acidobacteria bacterium]|jgi:tricorn protease|nr:S41 family peptidase [Acidobacteriota bacterium]
MPRTVLPACRPLPAVAGLPFTLLVLLPLLAGLALPGAAAGPASPPGPAAAPLGYYRQPALRGDTIVFVSEGDLWKVSTRGGVASRLTTDAAGEGSPAISPDGTTVAFVGRYDGPAEVYTMPLAGGTPVRHTWQASSGRGTPIVSGWTSDGQVIYATSARSTLPSAQLETLDPATGASRPIPLAEASDGAWNEAGTALFFVRLPFQGSHTKRYRGGTVQQIWRWDGNVAEAVPLTADYPGTSRNPMAWNGRVYFLSDRDGTMNLWSMTGDGKDVRQHTARPWDIAEASLDAGRIAFRSGADLFLFDLATGTETPLAITLGSDLDQTRERTVKDPLSWTTSAHLAPDGTRVVLTARGQVFVAPVGPGRFVEASRRPGVRFRDARFLPDGKALLSLSDESGEIELWTLPANGVGDARQVTRDGEVLRWLAIPSPDGARAAHTDKNQRLWLTELATGATRKLDESAIGDVEEPAWSPDGRWLAAAVPGDNLNRRVRLYAAEAGARTADGAPAAALYATTDRYDSSNPVFSADGKWLVFLSERHLESLVPGPWGLMQPEPFFDKTTRIYLLPLTPGLRSPFEPPDELHPADAKKDEDAANGDKKKDGAAADGAKKKKDAAADEAGRKTAPETAVTAAGLEARLVEVPVPPGNYRGLFATEKSLFWLSSATGERGKADLQALEITSEKPEVKTVLAGVAWAEPSADGKKILARKDDALYVFAAAAAPVSDLDKKKLDLSAFTLTVDPREEWRQMFNEAWRLERDYFYDRAMHGVDWNAMRARYLPLVERVRSRGELSDLLAQMVSEVEALHTFVYGGDARKGDAEPDPAFLGARLTRDAAAGGLRVDSIYRSDPDRPELASPLARPGVDVKPGDVILAIDGVAALSAPDPGALLRAKAGRQVLLSVKPAAGGAPREAIVRPLTPDEDADRRYHEWEYTRRLRTDEASGGSIGYVHLRAMGGEDYSSWARDYYPVFTRQGLIVDVRHNRGGNIDSWILSRLLRRAWFYWSQRVGRAPSWNMQYAFRGHVVVLVDQFTASDGEAFAEGFRRLGLGPVVGMRTWGGEIWLSSSNVLVDRGIATAAEFGVFGPEGTWLIEGHGVEPDIVVDNLPRATFDGQDAQLEAAIRLLQEKIAQDPRPLPPVPPLPRKGPPAR